MNDIIRGNGEADDEEMETLRRGIDIINRGYGDHMIGPLGVSYEYGAYVLRVGNDKAPVVLGYHHRIGDAVLAINATLSSVVMFDDRASSHPEAAMRIIRRGIGYINDNLDPRYPLDVREDGGGIHSIVVDDGSDHGVVVLSSDDLGDIAAAVHDFHGLTALMHEAGIADPWGKGKGKGKGR